MDIAKNLEALFDAERKTRAMHELLLESKPEGLTSEIEKKMQALEGASEEEVALCMVRMAALLQNIEGPKACDLLVRILNMPSVEARLAAGEALEGIAYSRFKELALASERALEGASDMSGALCELTYILAEVNEPGTVKLLGKFLKHKDVEVVASAIDALAELGDPEGISFLKKLEKDARRVQLEDDEEDISIAELASEAIEMIEETADAEA